MSLSILTLNFSFFTLFLTFFPISFSFIFVFLPSRKVKLLIEGNKIRNLDCVYKCAQAWVFHIFGEVQHSGRPAFLFFLFIYSPVNVFFFCTFRVYFYRCNLKRVKPAQQSMRHDHTVWKSARALTPVGKVKAAKVLLDFS